MNLLCQILAKLKNLLCQIFSKFKTRKDLEPEANYEKIRYSDEAISDFFSSFISFHFLISIACLIILGSCRRTIFVSVPESYESYRSPPHPIPSFCLESGFGGGSKNLYESNFAFDFHAFLNENETNIDLEGPPIWSERNLIYGADNRSVFSFYKNVSISEVSPVMLIGNEPLRYFRNTISKSVKNKTNPFLTSQRVRTNGSLYLHVYIAKSGFSPAAKKSGSYFELFTFHKTKRLTVYDKSNGSSDIRFYWHSNWTVDLVDDQSTSLKGEARKLVNCDPLTGKYYPILYLNDKL